MQSVSIRLAVGSLRPSSGNPRRVFDPVKMAELVASVKEKGVVTPIAVRPFDENTYEIIAGERRWRAAKEAHGEEYQIAAEVFTDITESEALEIAIIENSHRADVSETEEAEAAAKLLGNCAGDRDEAARRLGWSRSKFDKRVALMACAEPVRTALAEGKIKLGHAELLATLSEPRQLKALGQVIESGVSVEEFKAAVGKYAMRLADAIFDKKECETCPSNSSQQRTLFATALEEGCCTNSPCYEAKTEAKIEQIREGLVPEHGNVRVIRPGEQFVTLKLIATGAKGVGEEQAKACRSCRDYGATVSAQPGTLGNVETGQCMNVSCNAKHVAARIRSEQQAAKAATAPKAPSKEGVSKGSDAQKPKAAKPAPAAKPTKVELRGAIKEYREKLWRNALARFVNRDWNTSLTTLAALFASGKFPSLMKGSTPLRGAATRYFPGGDGHSLDAALSAIDAAPAADATTQFVQRIAPAACLDIDLRNVEVLLAHHKVNLADFWKIESSFLEILTKAELEIVAEATGIKDAMGEDKYKKALGGKKDQLIAAFLSVEGFNYAVVPDFLQYQTIESEKDDD